MKRLAVLVAAAAMLLTGCAEMMNPDPLASDLASELEEYQSRQEYLPEPGAEEPEPEPELPSAFSLPYHKDHTLDPVTCPEGLQDVVSSLLYEPLFRLDKSFHPEPVLCGSYEWDETGLVCTLELREGVSFSDGSALTARDVVENLLRAKESERYAYRLRHVTGITANRAGQVLLTLDAPNQGLPALLDIPVVKRTTAEQMVPVGTGPYMLVSDSEGTCLQAREDWWQQKNLPVNSIPLIHAKDQDTALHLFHSKRIELLTVDPTADVSQVNGKSEAVSQPTTILQFIGFNTAEGRLFADPALRGLFSQGIDRETLVHAQLAQLAAAAQFPVSPEAEIYPKDLEKAYREEEFLDALRTAGQDSGETKELTFLVGGSDSFRSTSARYIAEHLSVLVWRINVVELPWEEYLAALEAGDFDLYFGEVRLTADWDLTDLLGTEGSLNYGGYTNAATDLLLQNFAAAGNRQDAAKQLFSHLQVYTPIAPVCFKNYSVLTHPNVVEGIEPAPGGVFHGIESWKIHLKTA